MKQYNKLEEFQVFEEETALLLLDNEKLISSFLEYLMKDFSDSMKIKPEKMNIFLKEKEAVNSVYTRYYYNIKPLDNTLNYPTSLIITDMYFSCLIRHTKEFSNKFEMVIKHIITYNNDQFEEKNIADFGCEFTEEKIIKYNGSKFKGEFNPLKNKLDSSGAITKTVKNSGIF